MDLDPYRSWSCEHQEMQAYHGCGVRQVGDAWKAEPAWTTLLGLLEHLGF